MNDLLDYGDSTVREGDSDTDAGARRSGREARQPHWEPY